LLLEKEGGVGEVNFTTANCRDFVARMGFKVGVLDADIYGPSMPIMFDVENETHFSEVNGRSKMKPIELRSQITLSIGLFTSQESGCNLALGYGKTLNQMMIFDYRSIGDNSGLLLIDLPPGTGVCLYASFARNWGSCSEYTTAGRYKKKKGQHVQSDAINDVPVLGVIENMAYFTQKNCRITNITIFGKEGAKKL
jgi:ATP-binding protein involved in chromosome partitioning